MARIVEGFRSFTCTPTRLSTNRMSHRPTCLCIPSRSWSSFTEPGGVEGWVGLDITMVSKQSAQGHCVTGITVVSYANHDASLGSWSAGDMSVELTTSRAASRDASHWVTEPLEDLGQPDCQQTGDGRIADSGRTDARIKILYWCTTTVDASASVTEDTE